MGVAGQHPCIRLGRTDVHAAIDQRGIDADQIQRKFHGQIAGALGFPGGSRTHEENERETVVNRGHIGFPGDGSGCSCALIRTGIAAKRAGYNL